MTKIMMYPSLLQHCNGGTPQGQSYIEVNKGISLHYNLGLTWKSLVCLHGPKKEEKGRRKGKKQSTEPGRSAAAHANSNKHFEFLKLR